MGAREIDVGSIQKKTGQSLAAESKLRAAQATFYALQATYGFLSPELWTATRYQKSPLQEFTDFLAKPTIGDSKPYMGASEPAF